jgi:prepilin-type N-terminal cleavage/methylation domain-containing protein
LINTSHRLKRQRDAGEINGFTLIEILIVIVVLGILAAVVIFALGGITGKTAQASCAADGSTVATAMADFTTQNGNTAVSMAGLMNGTVANGNSPYIQSWPNNTPHYGFFLGDGTHGSTAGTLYVVTGAFYVSPGVYTLSSGDAGNLTPAEVTAATTTGNTTGVPALIAYTGPGVCTATTTAVS